MGREQDARPFIPYVHVSRSRKRLMAISVTIPKKPFSLECILLTSPRSDEGNRLKSWMR